MPWQTEESNDDPIRSAPIRSVCQPLRGMGNVPLCRSDRAETVKKGRKRHNRDKSEDKRAGRIYFKPGGIETSTKNCRDRAAINVLESFRG